MILMEEEEEERYLSRLTRTCPPQPSSPFQVRMAADLRVYPHEKCMHCTGSTFHRVPDMYTPPRRPFIHLLSTL